MTLISHKENREIKNPIILQASHSGISRSYSLVIFILQCLLRPLPRGARSDTGPQLQVAGETFLDFYRQLFSASGARDHRPSSYTNGFLIKSKNITGHALCEIVIFNQRDRHRDNQLLIGKQIFTSALTRFHYVTRMEHRTDIINRTLGTLYSFHDTTRVELRFVTSNDEILLIDLLLIDFINRFVINISSMNFLQFFKNITSVCLHFSILNSKCLI